MDPGNKKQKISSPIADLNLWSRSSAVSVKSRLGRLAISLSSWWRNLKRFVRKNCVNFSASWVTENYDGREQSSIVLRILVTILKKVFWSSAHWLILLLKEDPLLASIPSLRYNIWVWNICLSTVRGFLLHSLSCCLRTPNPLYDRLRVLFLPHFVWG